MDWIKFALWCIGGWMFGSFVVSMFGTQILIVRNCAMKLWNCIRNEQTLWDSVACKRYLDGVVRRNTVILAVITVLVICLAPAAAIAGYCIGAILAWVTGKPMTGMTKDNVEETGRIFQRYARPGMEETFRQDFHDMATWERFRTIGR